MLQSVIVRLPLPVFEQLQEVAQRENRSIEQPAYRKVSQIMGGRWLASAPGLKSGKNHP